MKIIGITGSSGSGKSTIAKIIADELNAKLIVADEVVKKKQHPGEKYYKEIVELLGKNYMLKDGILDRKKIAKLIYNDETKRKRLNEITEKYIVKDIKNQIRNTTSKYIVLDVPLLFESGLNRVCDYTIAMVSNKETQVERICKRDKITKKEAMERLNIQPNSNFYKDQASYIIENEGEVDDKLMGRIREILQELQ